MTAIAMTSPMPPEVDEEAMKELDEEPETVEEDEDDDLEDGDGEGDDGDGDDPE